MLSIGSMDGVSMRKQVHVHWSQADISCVVCRAVYNAKEAEQTCETSVIEMRRSDCHRNPTPPLPVTSIPPPTPERMTALLSRKINDALCEILSTCFLSRFRQKAQLSQKYRVTRCVSWNLVDCCAVMTPVFYIPWFMRDWEAIYRRPILQWTSCISWTVWGMFLADSPLKMPGINTDIDCTTWMVINLRLS